MKKVLFVCAGLLLLSTSMNAQSKEEKAAISAANKALKTAEREYTMSIPNLQYGRKVTNFEKLDGAKSMIADVLNNKYTKDNAQAYKVASDIYMEYYKKYEEESKTDESLKGAYIDAACKVVDYSIKYDSLAQLDPKRKDAEKTFITTQTQQAAVNPLIQCLQAAQNYSTSEAQADLVKGRDCASLVIRGFVNSHLFATFKNDSKEDWITYAKAFRAQSVAAIETSSAKDVEEAWNLLMGTKYESAAYSSLLNYYNDRDKAKYLEILKKAYEKGNPEVSAQFAFMYVQNLFQSENKDLCLKVIDEVIAKYPDNENTVNAYLMKGQIYFEKRDFDTAGKIFSEAAAKYPDEERATTMPAKCAWMKAQSTAKKEDRETAIKLFKELEAKYPTSPEHWGEALYILYNNNNQPALRDKYKKYYNVN